MIIEKKEHKGHLLAIIVRNSPDNGEELIFPTPADFPLQLGIHDRKIGTLIKPHVHISFSELKDLDVQEFIYLERGKLGFDLYYDDQIICNVILKAKDMILLNCGHSLEFLEDSKIIEIKQGPYRGNEDEKRYIN